MQNRILQFDYLKGIMMILVIMFHLVIIDVTYPTLRAAVYTFHVPVFLLLSGYLAKTDKCFKDFSRTLYRLLVPYVIFEIIYLLMLYVVGTAMHSTNSVDNLSFHTIFMHLLAYPLGSYWYLHALIVCYVVYYMVFHFLKANQFTKLILVGIILYLITYIIQVVGWAPITSGGGFVWESVVYYIIGIIIYRLEVPFMKIIPPSCFAIIPLTILFLFSDNYHRGTLAGISITILTISFLMYVFNYLWSPVRDGLCFIGRNSLTIFIFSPIFTSFTKFFIPFFSFDSTHIVFATVSTTFIIICSLMCAYFFDRLRFSRYLFMKDEILL